MPKEIEKCYFDNLEYKLKETLSHIENYSENFTGELAFYRFKSKSWVGNVLSARNKYAHWLFPFFDIKLALAIINLKDKDRDLQRRLINDLNKEFESINFGNGDDKNVIWSKIKKRVKKITSKSKSKINTNVDYQYESIETQHKLIYNVTKINKEYLNFINANRVIPRYDALSALLNSIDNSKLY